MAHSATSVARYVLWLGRGTDMTPMRLQKLIYISHGWMLALLDKPLFSDTPEAWQYGPVVPAVYQEYKKFGGNAITDVPASEPEGFTPEEKNLMQKVWDSYRGFSAIQLSSLTHQPNTPWAITRQLVGNGAAISNDLIKEHYRVLAEARK
jgi:uncharacterized phage-associated protein